MNVVGPLGKRAIKRLRLENIVMRLEREKMEAESQGLVWKGVSKSLLVRSARVGKNYIDGLDSSDNLLKRIYKIIHNSSTRAAKRDIEYRRLEKIRELEDQLIIQARSKAELVSENNRLRVDLTRSERRILAYERHYASSRPAVPDVRTLQSETEIIDFPTKSGSDGQAS